jgi:flagellar basal-body rod protein FlgB
MPPPGEIETAKDAKQKITYEVAPAGNAVIIEEQMVKANETNMEYTLLTNLMRKQSGMIRTALGRGQ